MSEPYVHVLLDDYERLTRELAEREAKFLIIHAQRDGYWQENARLRAALERIAKWAGYSPAAQGLVDIAREALGEPKP